MRTRKKIHPGRGIRGQVLVEYLLMVVVALSVILVIQRGLRRSVFTIWKQFAQEISAACPKGCLRDPRIR